MQQLKQRYQRQTEDNCKIQTEDRQTDRRQLSNKQTTRQTKTNKQILTLLTDRQTEKKQTKRINMSKVLFL